MRRLGLLPHFASSRSKAFYIVVSSSSSQTECHVARPLPCLHDGVEMNRRGESFECTRLAGEPIADVGVGESKRATEEQLQIGSDTWWIEAAVLTGILTMAFGMFAVIVAIPKVIIETISGAPPDLRRLLRGCSFAPRCRYTTEACTATMPEADCRWWPHVPLHASRSINALVIGAPP